MGLSVIPNLWNSAHRPIEYRYTFSAYAFTSVALSVDSAALVMSVPDAANFSVGQRVYIPSGVSAGTWTVIAILGGVVKISAPFVSTYAGTATPMTNINAELYAGYPSSHDGYADIPYRKLADIVGIPSINGYVPFDVSGYLTSIFKKIEFPRTWRDFRMSAPFELVISGEAVTERFVLNGTFEQSSLQTFNGDYKILNAREPIHFKDGVVFYSMINPDTSVYGEHIVNVFGVNGDGFQNVFYLGIGFSQIGTTFVVS